MNHSLTPSQYRSAEREYVNKCRYCDDILEDLETLEQTGSTLFGSPLTSEELENELMTISGD